MEQGTAIRSRPGEGARVELLRSEVGSNSRESINSPAIEQRYDILGITDGSTGDQVNIAVRRSRGYLGAGEEKQPEWFYQINGVRPHKGCMVGLPSGLLKAARRRCDNASIVVCGVRGKAYLRTEVPLEGAFQLHHRLGRGERIATEDRRFRLWKVGREALSDGPEVKTPESKGKVIGRPRHMTTETDLADLTQSADLSRKEVNRVLCMGRGGHSRIRKGAWRGWTIYRVT